MEILLEKKPGGPPYPPPVNKEEKSSDGSKPTRNKHHLEHKGMQYIINHTSTID